MKPFEKVPLDYVPKIVASLKPDGQNATVPCQMLQLYAECKKADLSLDVQLYTPGAEIDPHGTFLLYCPDHRGCIIFHSMTVDGLLEAIQAVDIDWDTNAWFGPIHQRFFGLMEDLIHYQGLRYQCPPYLPAFNMAMSREKALGLTIEVPEGLELRPITLEDAEFVDSQWPHSDDTTLYYIRNNIRVNNGVALCRKETGEKLSWCLFSLVGGVGMLQTDPNHRRKGYGEIVLKAMTKSVAEYGFDPQIQANTDLRPSYSLSQKIGYEITHLVRWYRLQRKL